MTAETHKEIAKKEGAVPVAIVTVSDSRTPETDTGGALIRELVSAAGHTVTDYRLIRDEPDQISALLDELTNCKVIIFSGGTGISPRDTTFDAISAKLEKTLPGFGEIFRMLSYAEIGSPAMLSRAVAGTYKGRIIFSTPGSPNAIRLALEKLILPELQHLAWEIMR
jgi:molybdopterin adenylyltransferase